jgi:hypothetical protein
MVVDGQDRVAELLEAGRRLVEVEHEFIEPAAGLDDDERAALWLYAWSYQETRLPRRPLEGSVRAS